MVRVAQVVTRFIAGAGGVALRGALALDSSRYAVTILAADGGPLLAEAELAGLEVVRLHHLRPEINPREDLAALRELTGELTRRQFDVVHTHSAKAGTLGRLAGHRVGMAAIVHTYHGFPFHRFQPWPQRAAYVEIERRLGRVTDRFLAIGSEVAAEAVRLGLAPAERVLTVASAIDPAVPKRTPATRLRARRRLGVATAGAPVIGTVGRIDAQKAPLDMLEAFEALGRPEARFVWIGDGPLRGRLEQHIARRGLQGRFVLTGERPDVPEVLAGLDVFVLASLYEGLPCALVEAMTCGLPVVATTVNAVPDVVVCGRTGLLAPPRAPRSLAAAVGYLLDHPDDAERMAAEAQDAVARRFHPELLGRDLMETYERARAERRQPIRGRVGIA